MKRVPQDKTRIERPTPNRVVTPSLPQGWAYIKDQPGLRFITPTFGLWKNCPMDSSTTLPALLGWPGECRGYMGPELPSERYVIYKTQRVRLVHTYTDKNPPYAPIYIVTDGITRYDAPRSECKEDKNGNQKKRRIMLRQGKPR